MELLIHLNSLTLHAETGIQCLFNCPWVTGGHDISRYGLWGNSVTKGTNKTWKGSQEVWEHRQVDETRTIIEAKLNTRGTKTLNTFSNPQARKKLMFYWSQRKCGHAVAEIQGNTHNSTHNNTNNNRIALRIAEVQSTSIDAMQMISTLENCMDQSDYQCKNSSCYYIKNVNLKNTKNIKICRYTLDNNF